MRLVVTVRLAGCFRPPVEGCLEWQVRNFIKVVQVSVRDTYGEAHEEGRIDFHYMVAGPYDGFDSLAAIDVSDRSSHKIGADELRKIALTIAQKVKSSLQDLPDLSKQPGEIVCTIIQENSSVSQAV